MGIYSQTELKIVLMYLFLGKFENSSLISVAVLEELAQSLSDPAFSGDEAVLTVICVDCIPLDTPETAKVIQKAATFAKTHNVDYPVLKQFSSIP